MTTEFRVSVVPERPYRTTAYYVDNDAKTMYLIYSPTISDCDLTAAIRRLEDEFVDGDRDGWCIPYILDNLPMEIRESIVAILFDTIDD